MGWPTATPTLHYSITPTSGNSDRDRHGSAVADAEHEGRRLEAFLDVEAERILQFATGANWVIAGFSDAVNCWPSAFCKTTSGTSISVRSANSLTISMATRSQV